MQTVLDARQSHMRPHPHRRTRAPRTAELLGDRALAAAEGTRGGQAHIRLPDLRFGNESCGRPVKLSRVPPALFQSHCPAETTTVAGRQIPLRVPDENNSENRCARVMHCIRRPVRRPCRKQ